jgi:hypothetical protein
MANKECSNDCREGLSVAQRDATTHLLVILDSDGPSFGVTADSN